MTGPQRSDMCSVLTGITMEISNESKRYNDIDNDIELKYDESSFQLYLYAVIQLDSAGKPISTEK